MTFRQIRPRWVTVAIGGSACVFAARLLWLIDRRAVNILFWDQWDFLGGLRQHLGL